MGVSKELSKGMKAIKQIKALIAKGQDNYAKISKLASKGVAAFNAANDKVQQAKKLIYRAQALQQSVVSAKNALVAMKQAADIHDFQSLMAANTNAEVAMYHLKGAACPVNTFVGSREGGA